MNLNTLEIFPIDNLSTNDWKKSIIDFFENPIGVTDKNKIWKIIENELFKKTLDGILLKFLSESEAYLNSSIVHIM